MTRRTYATLLCFAWVLCVEVLPSVHLAGHADGAPHTHAVDGTIITVSFDHAAEHRHVDGSVHAHAEAHVAAAPARNHRAASSSEDVLDLPEHAARGIAHHAEALRSASPWMVDAPRLDIVTTVAGALGTNDIGLAFLWTRNARGPPHA